MILDLLDSSNLKTYNITIANLLGLHTAVYLSVIISVNNKAIKKSKINDGFFLLDRDYVTRETTLTKQEQLAIDSDLQNVSILTIDKNNPDLIKFSAETLATYLIGVEEKLKEDIQASLPTVKRNKTAKLSGNKSSLLKHIRTTDTQMIEAYDTWISSIQEKFGPIQTLVVETAQNKIDEFSDRDLDTALEILNIATINQYRDIEYAIKRYNERHKSFNNFKLNSSQSFSDNTFNVDTDKITLSKEYI